MKNLLQSLQGKEVDVDFRGMLYQGILLDASENEIFLRVGDLWMSLPMEEVGDIRLCPKQTDGS